MGAYGAALLARSRTPDGAAPTPLTSASLRSLDISAKTLRCKGCGNHCLLTVNRFSNGRKLVSGNRCERGASGGEAARPSMPNLYAWKERRLFGYEPLPQDDAPRGRIGIPRVLNMYEHYPFWFTLFTELGYRVELSPPSDKELFDLGLSSMPSQTVCYPAKLAHGHIASLLRKGLKRIFFPCLPRERRESKDAADGYNCPVVAGYPEVIRLNTDELLEQDCTLYTPFVSLEHPDTLVAALHDLFGIPKKELRAAVRVAALEQADLLPGIRFPQRLGQALPVRRCVSGKPLPEALQLRILREKRLQKFLQILTFLHENAPSFSLICAGNGPQSPRGIFVFGSGPSVPCSGMVQ